MTVNRRFYLNENIIKMGDKFYTGLGTYYKKKYITRKIHKGVNMTGNLDDRTCVCWITFIELTLIEIIK